MYEAIPGLQVRFPEDAVTPHEAAFRESFYRCCTSDLARIRMLSSRHAGFMALALNGEPVTYALGDHESQRRYLAILERADIDCAVESLGLSVWR